MYFYLSTTRSSKYLRVHFCISDYIIHCWMWGNHLNNRGILYALLKKDSDWSRQRAKPRSRRKLNFFPRRSEHTWPQIHKIQYATSGLPERQGRRNDDVGHARMWKEGSRGFIVYIRYVLSLSLRGGASFTRSLCVVAYLPAIYELISCVGVAREINIAPLLTNIRVFAIRWTFSDEKK